MKNIPKKKIILLAILTILFLLPFFWSDNRVFNLGGDDSRFYYFRPYEWLVNVGLRSWFSPTGLADYNTQFSYLPFTLLGSLVSKFLNFQKVTYGAILAFGFFSTFSVVSSFISQNGNKGFIASVVSGLLYIFMPVVFFTQWIQPIKSIIGIFLYPFLFLCFLKAAEDKRIAFLIIGAFISGLFSISMSSIPFLFPFFLFSFLFFFLYFLLNGRLHLFTVYSFLYFILITGFNSFWLVPFAYSVFANSVWSGVLAPESGGIAASGAGITASARSLADALRGHFSFQALTSGNVSLSELGLPEFYYQISFLGFVIPLVILFSFFVKSAGGKRFKLAVLTTGIVSSFLLFLQVVNIGSWGVDLFQFLMRSIPGFVVIRTFYAKIPMAFSFFYSLLFGLSFFKIIQQVDTIKVKILTLFVIFVILIQAQPFIVGTLDNSPIKAGSRLTRNVFFSQQYLDSLTEVKDFVGEDRFFLLPPTTGSYAFIKTDNPHGLYVGTSPFKTLFGMEVFAGKRGLIGQGLLNVDKVMERSIRDRNFNFIKKTLGIIGVRYIYFDKRSYHVAIDEGIKEQILWPGNYFHTQKQTLKFIDKLGLKKVKENHEYSLYEFNDHDFAKRFYLPEKIILAPSSKNYSLAEVLEKTEPLSDFAYFFADELGEKSEPIMGAELFQSEKLGKYTLLKRKEKPSFSINYKMITPELYQVDIKGVKKAFPLIFSERFNSGWKAYIISNGRKINLKGGVFDYRKLFFKSPLSEQSHFLTNGYANAWWIEPQREAGGAKDFEIILEFWPHRMFYLGILISSLTFLCSIVYLGGIFVKGRKIEQFELRRLLHG